MNIPHLSTKIARAALGLCDPGTSEAPSPRGVESSLVAMQRLGATEDGPAPTDFSHRHRAQDGKGDGSVPDESAVTK
jgi:hypothetical protein